MIQIVNEKLSPFGIDVEDIERYIVTYNRGDTGFATIITKKEKVYKLPLNDVGISVLEDIANNHRMLQKSGLSVVTMEVVAGVGIMEKIKLPTFVDYIQRYMDSGNKEKIICCLKNIYDDIQHSSEHTNSVNILFKRITGIAGNSCYGEILKDAFPEMLPQNCFFDGKKNIWFDQESRVGSFPVAYIFARFIRHLYYQLPRLHFFMPMNEVKSIFSAPLELWDVYSKISYNQYVEKEKRVSNSSHIEQLADDIVIVGSGKWGVLLLDILEQCGSLENVKRILDNDSSKWGKYINNIPISSIDEGITNLNVNTSVIVAIKNSSDVLKQLQQLKRELEYVYLLEIHGYGIELKRYVL